MNKCSQCYSYAINHHCHGRDGSDADLCDVCYWRKRAETISAQPAGEVPEILGYLNDIGLHWTKDSAEFNGSPVRELIDKAQHTRIVAALQARAVVMPGRMLEPKPIWAAAPHVGCPLNREEIECARSHNACLDEVARLNGKGGVCGTSQSEIDEDNRDLQAHDDQERADRWDFLDDDSMQEAKP